MTRLVKVVLTVVAIVGIGAVAVGAQTKVATPIRGDAEIGYLKPVTTVDQKAGIVKTTIKVKNLSPTGSIAGLKVEEFWYDKAGNLVVGGDDWCRKPLMPGDEWTATITTARDTRMYTNNLKFSHANGTVKPKKVKKFE